MHDIDADQTGWSRLCESFKGSSIEELSLSDIGMGVNGVASLADAIKFMATVARLTLSGNAITKYGKDLTGLKALCEALFFQGREEPGE